MTATCPPKPLGEGGIILHRTDPAKNMSRFYRLDVQPDLFGQWCVILNGGALAGPDRCGRFHTPPPPTRTRRLPRSSA